jgi:transcriptional regulator with XRE-family HTH domain
VNINELLGKAIAKNIVRYEAIVMNTQLIIEIDEYRKKHGITKKQLAEAAGVNPAYLSQVYNSNKLINLSMLAGISQKFNIRFGLDIQDISKESEIKLDHQSFPLYETKKTKVYNFNEFTKELSGTLKQCSDHKKVSNGY